MQIGAALRLAVRLRLALLQDVGEQIAERRRRRAADADREVEPLEAEASARRAADRGPPRVVAPPPIRIAQRLVRLGDLPELRGRQRDRPG